MSSVCSSPISVQPLTLLVDCWLKSEEFPKQMAISSAQNSSDKSLFLRKLTGFVPQLWIFYRTLSCFVCSSLHLCLSSSVAQFQLVLLRPPSNFFIHSLSIPVLSETQLQKAFSPNAGAFSLGHSLPQYAYGMVRVPRNLDPALYHCSVLVEFLSVSDPTMMLVVELLESFISAYYYVLGCQQSFGVFFKNFIFVFSLQKYN